MIQMECSRSKRLAGSRSRSARTRCSQGYDARNTNMIFRYHVAASLISFQQWRMPVPIVSSSTISSDAQRRSPSLSLQDRSPCSSPSSKRWTCMVNLRWEKSHGTLPRATPLSGFCPFLDTPPSWRSSKTKSCAVCLRTLTVLSFDPGRM